MNIRLCADMLDICVGLAFWAPKNLTPPFVEAFSLKNHQTVAKIRKGPKKQSKNLPNPQLQLTFNRGIATINSTPRSTTKERHEINIMSTQTTSTGSIIDNGSTAVENEEKDDAPPSSQDTIDKSSIVASLQQKLNDRRSSLTPSEFTYVKSLLSGDGHDEPLCDDKMSILEENLNDSNVFFHPDEIRTEEDDVDRANDKAESSCGSDGGVKNSSSNIGSDRRNQKLKQRRSKSVAKWKQATMKIMACNRLVQASRPDGGLPANLATLINAIKEGGDETKSDSEDDTNEEKKNADTSDDLLSSNNQTMNLMTRRATINMYGGEGFEIGEHSLFRENAKHFDPWDVTTDRDGNPYEFHIIGTSADDVDAHPHVLSPPQMHSLQQYLPYSKRGESFWLKYSLVRYVNMCSIKMRRSDNLKCFYCCILFPETHPEMVLIRPHSCNIFDPKIVR